MVFKGFTPASISGPVANGAFDVGPLRGSITERRPAVLGRDGALLKKVGGAKGILVGPVGASALRQGGRRSSGCISTTAFMLTFLIPPRLRPNGPLTLRAGVGFLSWL